MFCLVQTTAISCRALSQLETSKHTYHVPCILHAMMLLPLIALHVQYEAWCVCMCRTVSHFMVVTESEFLLVDPARSKIGWGIVHFISFLQVCWALLGSVALLAREERTVLSLVMFVHRMWMWPLTQPTAALSSSQCTATPAPAGGPPSLPGSSLRTTFAAWPPASACRETGKTCDWPK